MLAAMQDLSPIPELGQSFGLGFAVRTDAGHTPVSGSVGEYFWAGYAGTYFWVDPQEKLFAVMMVQMPFVPAGAYRRALREMAYGALLH
jgi:CubicO group peptidase (beta-lactamase class C family)